MRDDVRTVAGALAWTLICTAVLGCGSSQKPVDPPPKLVTTPPPAAAPEVPPKPPSVTLRIDGRSVGKDTHELSPGETLRSGDQMAVNVAVDQAAYVYVAFASAGGPPQVVFPKSGDEKVTPEQPLRIPANPERWIILDKQTGQEDILVYASIKPIPSADLLSLINTDAADLKKAAARRAAAQAATRPQKGKGKAKAGPGPAEEPLSASSRGVQIEDDDSGAAKNPGIVHKRFSVTHK